MEKKFVFYVKRISVQRVNEDYSQFNTLKKPFEVLQRLLTERKFYLKIFSLFLTYQNTALAMNFDLFPPPYSLID